MPNDVLTVFMRGVLQRFLREVCGWLGNSTKEQVLDDRVLSGCMILHVSKAYIEWHFGQLAYLENSSEKWPMNFLVPATFRGRSSMKSLRVLMF